MAISLKLQGVAMPKKSLTGAARVKPGSGMGLYEKSPELKAKREVMNKAGAEYDSAMELLNACALLGDLAERHVEAGVAGAKPALDWLISLSCALVIPTDKRKAVLAALKKSQEVETLRFLLAAQEKRSYEPLMTDDD